MAYLFNGVIPNNKVKLSCVCFPGGSLLKNLSINVGDTGSIPGSGRSPAVGHGNAL